MVKKTLCRAAALFLCVAVLLCLTPGACAQAQEAQTTEEAEGIRVGWTDYLLVAAAAGVIAGVGHLALRAMSRRIGFYESTLHKKYGRFTKDEEPPET